MKEVQFVQSIVDAGIDQWHRRPSASVRVHGTFRAQIVTILNRSVMTTNILLNKS